MVESNLDVKKSQGHQDKQKLIAELGNDIHVVK